MAGWLQTGRQRRSKLTGRSTSSFTAQTPILGGTTTTGPLQSATEPTSDIIWGWDDTDDLTKAITIGSGLTYTHSSHTLSAGADLDSIGDPIGGAHNYRYLRTDGSAQLAENAALTSGILPKVTTNGLFADSQWSFAGSYFVDDQPGGGTYTLLNSGEIDVESNSGVVFITKEYADADGRFTIDPTGALQWGTGAAPTDTILSRLSAGVLQIGSNQVAVITTLPGSTLPAKLSSTGGLTASAIDLSSGSQVSGNLGVGHLNSGTNADSSHYWRGDATWATIPLPNLAVTQGIGNGASALTLATVGTTYACYIGRFGAPVNSLSYSVNITSPGALTPTLITCVATGAYTYGANASLTAVAAVTETPGWTSGIKTDSTNFTGMNIAPNTDVWLLIYTLATTVPYHMNGGLPDTNLTGVLQTYTGDGTTGGAHTFTVNTNTTANPWLIATALSS